MNYDALLGLATVMGTVVAVVGIIAGAYKRRLAFMERKLELAASIGSESASRREADLAAQGAELERRMRVLERIVTDEGGSQSVALQIEALRDPGVLEVTKQ
ncbi:MAG TPA: hypothetical protein VMQ93_13045 [Novosphingobium sp.]|nr:hypothetical protein [Novosphingobium sp.]